MNQIYDMKTLFIILGILFILVSIQNVSAEGDKVYLHVHVTAKNLDMHAVHMFTVKDGIQTEMRIFDDTQKLSKALG